MFILPIPSLYIWADICTTGTYWYIACASDRHREQAASPVYTWIPRIARMLRASRVYLACDCNRTVYDSRRCTYTLRLYRPRTGCSTCRTCTCTAVRIYAYVHGAKNGVTDSVLLQLNFCCCFGPVATLAPVSNEDVYCLHLAGPEYRLDYMYVDVLLQKNSIKMPEIFCARHVD